MIQDASQHIYDDPWLMVPTGVVLALTVVAANELADAIAGKATAEKQPSAAPDAASVASAATRRPADPDAVLEVRDLSVAVDDGPAAGHRRLVRPAAGPGARPGRRVRLRQDDDRPLPAGPAARRRLGLRRLDPLAGPRARRPVGEASSPRVRGREIAMISQEPMVALDPMFSVAYQLTQPIRRFRGVGRAEAQDDRRRAAAAGRHRRRRAGAEVATRTSSPAAWRSASASPWR